MSRPLAVVASSLAATSGLVAGFPSCFGGRRPPSLAVPCGSNLTQIEQTKEAWAVIHKKDVGAIVACGMEALAKSGPRALLRRVPVCPEGGVYTLNAIGVRAQGSVHGALHREREPLPPEVVRAAAARRRSAAVFVAPAGFAENQCEGKRQE